MSNSRSKLMIDMATESRSKLRIDLATEETI